MSSAAPPIVYGLDAGAAEGERDFTRQIAAFGKSAQARIAMSNVLLVGLRGVGVEIAKNLILMGVRSVSLFDPEPTTVGDLSSQVRARATCGRPPRCGGGR